VVIFGGSGFIGTHLTRQLIGNELAKKVVVVDIAELDSVRFGFCGDLFSDERVVFAKADVREPLINRGLPSTSVDLIVNLAAVHREPGHAPEEYFETNLKGAENVCEYAAQVGCSQIIFTSSIAPYGPSELEKTELSLPVPVSAYGASKLVAEKTHEKWQLQDQGRNRLIIVRPGVVFGSGEGGNVTRLVRAVSGRYFVFMGNKRIRKAGGYVKELVSTMFWALARQQQQGPGVLLYNFSMNPGPSVQEYTEAVCKTIEEERWVPQIPFKIIISIAYVLDFFAKPLRIQNPFSPVRVRKLVRSNNISPRYLVDNGYRYQYTLEEAFLDWKNENPADWA
jgi:nucleoside-diphosphate-sugar epimerase